MAGQCFPLVGGRVMRVTRLNGCGFPTRPTDSDYDENFAQVTSDGFVSVEVTANIEEGDAISVTNAAGKICVSQTPCPTLTGYTVNMTFCNVDPDLFALVTGQESIVDPDSGDGIGFVVDTSRSGCDRGFALELWSSVPGVTCPVDENGDPIEGAEQPSGYILFPFLQGGVFGDFTIENDAVSFVVSGATTKDGSGWGKGPYDVVLSGGAAGPLYKAITGRQHLLVMQTFVAPPEPSCGGAPLVAVVATGATAGTPGTWTPADSTPPSNAAGASSVTASPNTAWTTGQYVQGSTAGSGGEMYWNGTAWTAGRAA